MSTLEQMQAFVAAVEQGSFTAASENFGISPAALSKKISVLEKSLGVKLLTRTPRLLVMTDIGRKYYDQCKKILHEYRLSHLVIECQSSDIAGSLSIVSRRHAAMCHIYPTMAVFLEKHPRLIAHVAINKELSRQSLQQYDLAIGYAPDDVLNDWVYRKINGVYYYFPNIKPIVPKIRAYLDYMVS
jgi:DNA-binding transcriptional LysR family regulator